MKDGGNFAKDSITDYWLDGIGDDFKKAKENYSSTRWGEFGGLFYKPWTWIWFGIKGIFRTATFPVGVAGGGVYSIVWPTLATGWKPIAALNGAVVPGTIFPFVSYVYNGIVWVGTLPSPVPTRNTAFVKLVYYPYSGDNGSQVKEELIIDQNALSLMMQAATMKVVTNAKNADKEKQIAQIQAKISEVVKPLRDQQAQLKAEEEENNKKLRQSAAQKYVSELADKAYRSQIKLNEDATEITLNQDQMQSMIKQYLAGLGVTDPSDQMISEIIEMIMRNLKSLHAEMAKTATPAALP